MSLFYKIENMTDLSKYYSIKDTNGVKTVSLPNNNFKKAIVVGISRFVKEIAPFVYEDNASPEQIAYCNNCSLDANDLAQSFLNYLYYEYIPKKYNFNSVLNILSGKDESVFIFRNLSLKYYPNKPLMEQYEEKIDEISEKIINDDDDDSDPEDNLEVKKLRQKIAILEAENNEYDFAYRSLIAELLNLRKEYLNNLFTDFEIDNPISFGELEFLFQNFNNNYFISIDGTNFVQSKITNCGYRTSMFGTFFEYNYQVTHWDGKKLRSLNMNDRFPAYEGKQQLSKFGLVFFSDKIKNAILSNAEKYIAFNSKPTYAYHNGSISVRSGWFSTSYQATGRCMVDVLGLGQLNPNFNDYVPSTADPEYDDGSSNVTEDGFDLSTIDENRKLKLLPYVYIFSFVCKKWARTSISNISEISFRDDAFEKLIIDEDVKDLMFSLVDIPKEFSVGKDIIDSKGGGSIFLLAGPPGVGKTLSAETMAETLHRPLYMVGVGELGTEVTELEENLTKVLQTASAWNAILLLDECDIFMEKRKDMDIHRNAMVGVFLRLLEYYPGILFLTTNRAANIDEAFYSRISFAVKYKDLDSQKRASIWTNILGLYKINLSEESILTLSQKEINGRQIKNAVKLVNNYCTYKKTIPTVQDFLSVIERMSSFYE